MREILRSFALLLPLFLLGPDVLSAQSILVQVTEEDTGQPITGAFLSLIGGEGRVLRNALSNSDGRYRFVTDTVGLFVVRAEMIGRASVEASASLVDQGDVANLHLRMPVSAIRLDEIQVEAEERCRLHPDEASEIALVWEEARKALKVQEWTEESELYRYRIVRYDRDLDPQARTVVRDNRRVTTTVTRNPIQSLPPSQLLSEGFIHPLEGSEYQYYGPDATVLLSREFLDTHCFHLTVDSGYPTRIGLRFAPLRGTPQPDISGTLWLDRETANLQFLEYRYDWSPHEETRDVAGGRVEFAAMPNGAWIVSRWWIRMPLLGQSHALASGSRSGIRLIGVRESGSEVVDASSLDQRRVLEAARGTLLGVVWDSTESTPLPGARVYLSGTSFISETDSLGRFEMAGVPEGVFTAAFTHPRLDSLGIHAKGADVEVRPGEAAEIRLSTPSPGTIAVLACQDEENFRGTSVLSGLVRDRATDQPIPRAEVHLDWQQVQGVTGRFWGQDRWLKAFTDGEGRFTLCGIPPDETISVRASFLDHESDTESVRLPEESFGSVTLEVDLPPGFLRTHSEALIVSSELGIQGAQGFITEPGTENPVRLADVFLRQNPGHVVVRGETDHRGFFSLQTPVPGAYALSVQALGYASLEGEPVEVSPGEITVLEVQMTPEALSLDPIVVVAESRPFHLEMDGFYERREMAGGYFITPEAIEERVPNRTTQLFLEVPGATIVQDQSGHNAVWFRRNAAFDMVVDFTTGEATAQPCWPRVLLDGMLMEEGGREFPANIDILVHPMDLAGIEVYRTPSEVPARFGGPQSRCGVILLWTKRGSGGLD